MTKLDRRTLLMAAAGAASLPPAIARAVQIDAAVRTGTIQDVEHVVILTQENRSFDHYFGSMAGVRGFGDRFPIPRPEGRTVWTQANGAGERRPPWIAPFHLNTVQTFAHMRVEGTPHNWPDAQAAWDEGRIGHWPKAKGEHAMGHYTVQDIPFQFALADAFTVCDAYHCAIQTGTNSNRLFIWTATNDPTGEHGGPSISNSHDRFVEVGGASDPYRWTTYVERLQAAGISWRIYQDMADNFTDNPTAGFKTFRDSFHKLEGSDPRLAAEGLSTFKLDRLKADVLAGKLPSVSYVVAGQKDSEHPGPSSPAQGADFTSRVLEALTADPKVWAKTVLFVNYDENDGFFDHMPPSAPPSKDASGALAGGSTVDTAGEYHLTSNAFDKAWERPELMGRPYGLGPRVPMFVISPWSRGGWVDSQIFDHTSVVRFLETRFGVAEPNISPWRRAVCGDLTSAFDFKTPNARALPVLPKTAEIAARADALPGRTKPPTPALTQAPVQAMGVRPSRALPYVLEASTRLEAGQAQLTFANDGRRAAVFHVYDRLHLDRVPRRYTVEGGKRLEGLWDLAADAGAYDLWILGPGGFHRHVQGKADAGPTLRAAQAGGRLTLSVENGAAGPIEMLVAPNAYQNRLKPWRVKLAAGAQASQIWDLGKTGGWYDLSATLPAKPGWTRRLAGRVETGKPSVSDPAMGGPAVMAG